MADGIRAPGRSVRTVGCFTDGHGRAAAAACSGLACGRWVGRGSAFVARRLGRSWRLPGGLSGRVARAFVEGVFRVLAAVRRCRGLAGV